MATQTKNGVQWEYTYDANGMRTSRTSGTKTYDYVYSGDKLVQMTVTDTTANTTQLLEFTYDAAGQPLTMTLDGTVYYYLLNIQGDVMGLVDGGGNLMLSLIYEGYGEGFFINNTSDMVTTLASTNPLGYRGYVMDAGTGLYYLQSRYYDPNIGRFLNADSQLNEKDGLLGYNQFAYCQNNPILYSDATGHSITLACIIIGAVIGAIVGACVGAHVSKKKTGEVNGWAVAGGTVGGAVVGGLIGWGAGAAITAIGAAATGAATTAAAPAVQQVAEKTSTALQTYYPPNDGFSGTIQKVTLEAGTLIQRTGSLGGQYVAPAGTPPEMLSLPYEKIGQATTILQVQQPVEVWAGRVSPWFGQIGCGIQYKLGVPLDQLISDGVINIYGG